MPPRSILFIHGLFMTCHCWDAWSARFQAKGYATRAFPYPLRDLPVEELRRRHPGPALGRLTLDQVVEPLMACAAAMVRSRPLLVYGLAALQGMFASDLRSTAAGIVITIVPILILFVFLQRQFVRGLSGAVKG